jgi:uncharacterized protein (DUF305 family)
VNRTSWRNRAAALLTIFAITACAAKDEAALHQHPDGSTTLPAPVIPEGAMFTVSDVRFMQGMIAHHGQAIVMSDLAATRTTNGSMLKFTQKIDLSQRAEIGLMQEWLIEREQAIPDSGAHNHMSMPGMLTAEQLKELEAARGKNFDRLFLTFMIQHHEGALKMVADLMDDPLGARDINLSVLAIDIDTDQRAEILRMHQMLADLQ